MAKTAKTFAPASCPQCGGALVAHPAASAAAITRTMVLQGANAPYAANFAAAVHEKEANHGIVHTCASCRYSLRAGGQSEAA
jgi:hypothetical protein